MRDDHAWYFPEHDTAAGEKREKKLAEIAEVLQKAAWELTFLCDELENEEREQPAGSA